MKISVLPMSLSIEHTRNSSEGSEIVPT